ncbi:MAG: ABC transporter ATP-binding protein [Planctomycetota bacterium]
MRAVDGVSLDVPRGQTVALVGESGCGKSLTALAVLRLVPAAAQITGGRILLDGRDLLELSERELRAVRGNRVAMIFQEPMTSLNPLLAVGSQIDEVLRLHGRARGRAARRRTVELLRRVGIPTAEERARAYPHQLSGGMRQRVMIAMALACEPELLIADEPTTALDVTVQAQILALLRELQQQTGMGLLFITHDLAVVGQIAHTTYVMYAGRIVEQGPTAALFARRAAENGTDVGRAPGAVPAATGPRHPYTRGLLRATPHLERAMTPQPVVIPQVASEAAGRAGRARLPVIPGDVPTLGARAAGCAFRPRCELGGVDPRCAATPPDLRGNGTGQAWACWLADGA